MTKKTKQKSKAAFNLKSISPVIYLSGLVLIAVLVFVFWPNKSNVNNQLTAQQGADEILNQIANCDFEKAEQSYLALANNQTFKKNCVKGAIKFKFVRQRSTSSASLGNVDGKNVNLEYTSTFNGVTNHFIATLIWDGETNRWIMFSLTPTTLNPDSTPSD